MKKSTSPQGPVRIPLRKHHIKPDDIDANALNVIYKLQKAGFEAYLVGGGVRDLVLGKNPKDFDIATDAKPEQVRRLFRNCRLIGRRFRLAHILFGRHVIEVATFRANHEKASAEHGHTREGMIVRDNVYGNMEDDAWRRDFAINALYYDVRDQCIVDYTKGFNDLKTRRLHVIGEATKRYKEDPVRMLRAVRFACKLDLTLSHDAREPIKYLADELQKIPPSRLFEEVLKLFFSGHALATWNMLREYHLFGHLFPQTKTATADAKALSFVIRALENTDLRIAQGKSINPAFLFAVFLWPSVDALSHQYRHDEIAPAAALDQAIYDVLKSQSASVSIPRRFTGTMQDIWQLQPRLHRRHGKKPYALLDNRRFRAAYDFLELRAHIEPHLQPLAQWWDAFYHGNEEQRHELLAQVPKPKRRPRKKA